MEEIINQQQYFIDTTLSICQEHQSDANKLKEQLSQFLSRFYIQLKELQYQLTEQKASLNQQELNSLSTQSYTKFLFNLFIIRLRNQIYDLETNNKDLKQQVSQLYSYIQSNIDEDLKIKMKRYEDLFEKNMELGQQDQDLLQLSKQEMNLLQQEIQMKTQQVQKQQNNLENYRKQIENLNMYLFQLENIKMELLQKNKEMKGKYDEVQKARRQDKINYRNQYDQLKQKGQDKIHRLKDIIIEYQTNLQTHFFEIQQLKNIILHEQEEKQKIIIQLQNANQKFKIDLQRIENSFLEKMETLKNEWNLRLLKSEVNQLEKEEQQKIQRHLDQLVESLSVCKQDSMKVQVNESLEQKLINNAINELVKSFELQMVNLKKKISDELIYQKVTTESPKRTHEDNKRSQSPQRFKSEKTDNLSQNEKGQKTQIKRNLMTDFNAAMNKKKL